LKPKKVSFEDAQFDVDILIKPKEEPKKEYAGSKEQEDRVKGEEPKEVLYIKYLNKDKGFKEDKKYFAFFDEAQEWGRANLDNFHIDMIHYEDAPKVEEEIDEAELLAEIREELSFLSELLEDAKEDKEKELISELEDRIEFLEELRNDALPFKNGGKLKEFNKIIVNFDLNYTPARLYFNGYSKNNNSTRIGWATSEVYFKSANVLNLQNIKLVSEYDNPENMKRIIALIKKDLEKKTGKNTLMIKNSIQ
jgi:hypothetical protein